MADFYDKDKLQRGRTEVANSKGIRLRDEELAGSTKILTLTVHIILYYSFCHFILDRMKSCTKSVTMGV